MVEWARLESVCTGNSTEGSNPSLSAINFTMNVLPFESVFLLSAPILRGIWTRKRVWKRATAVSPFGQIHCVCSEGSVKLRRKIDTGLANSKFELLCYSKNLLLKDGLIISLMEFLLRKSLENNLFFLFWHINKKSNRFCPSIANKLARNTATNIVCLLYTSPSPRD